MKKNNLKSVRISDQVMSYIQGFEGDGFNQKFENLVLFCMEEEVKKRKIIEVLDSEIKLKHKQIAVARQFSTQLSRASYLMNDVEEQLQALVRQMCDMGVHSDTGISKTALQPGAGDRK